jgi:predicted amidohydrolase
MGAGADKEFNIAKAKGFMQEAKAKGAEVIVLPEVRNLVC